MAKTIMIQGTTSNAGKSFLVAALCRIFRQDGFKVAPFKSQNMALNSYITKDGLEMGRAQVMQAEAAGIEPSVYMNPILLKPTTDTGSQVIVNGHPIGTMSAKEYFRYKKNLVGEIQKAFDFLAEQNDIIVLEGAGSPAEINLKENDIVNMGMAAMANAPVLLAGDIDRGGVFASLYGTVALMDEWEKKHLKGTVINKFRGDSTILQPGLKRLEVLCNVPVVGVIPYGDVDIDDEDSLSERFDRRKKYALIDIAVIRLPRISNFTDFNPLEEVESVGIRYVSSPQELGRPDLILLPGTKNTMSDLLWMRQNGLEVAILKLVSTGVPLFGICGGYQMLGRDISDPECVENGGKISGMGLLPVDTVFSHKKVMTRKRAVIQPLTGVYASLSNIPIEGYEIHMGQTDGESCQSFSKMEDGKEDGAWTDSVAGTYFHGIFDQDLFRRKFVALLMARKGLSIEDMKTEDRKVYKDRQYEKMAQIVRNHMDMDYIYRILEEGIGGKDHAARRD
ncbi:MAG: cobyric acid synthase [Clostridiales bacterium]|nr:cobyric acid synthase [Clostridiales bacterium]